MTKPSQDIAQIIDDVSVAIAARRTFGRVELEKLRRGLIAIRTDVLQGEQQRKKAAQVMSASLAQTRQIADQLDRALS